MNDDRLYTQDDLKEIMAAAAEGAALFTDTLARWFARTLDIPPGVALQHAKSIEREIARHEHARRRNALIATSLPIC